jgi:hypothetical protein
MIVELRRYTMLPGRRDTLIDIFDREFVESHEELGMAVIGQFRDLDDPDQFVWVRGFPSMGMRADALDAFYSGPVWKEHGPAANATMVDTDNVLLLRVVSPFPELGQRPLVGAAPPGSVVVATIHQGDQPFPDGFVPPGPSPLASFRTEYAENNFPGLPVRTDVHAFVTFDRFETVAQASSHTRDGAAERLVLAPTGRSRLR